MGETRPVIGVIGCSKPLEGEVASTVKARYLDAVVTHADAIPLIVPSLIRASDVSAILGRLDAVLLTGSTSNIAPHHFGSDAGREPFDAQRDETSLALVHAAQSANIPLIGICRGLQEINVALGGTLTDHRDADEVSDTHHAPDDASLEEMFNHFHEVDVAPGSLLSEVTGNQQINVNSVHYQTIARLGDGLRIEATAADNVIEAISSRDGHSIFAVQWHPEWRPETRPHDLAIWRHIGNLARASFAQAR